MALIGSLALRKGKSQGSLNPSDWVTKSPGTFYISMFQQAHFARVQEFTHFCCERENFRIFRHHMSRKQKFQDIYAFLHVAKATISGCLCNMFLRLGLLFALSSVALSSQRVYQSYHYARHSVQLVYINVLFFKNNFPLLPILQSVYVSPNKFGA